jgi:hypothetical protein
MAILMVEFGLFHRHGVLGHGCTPLCDTAFVWGQWNAALATFIETLNSSIS